MGLRCVRYRVSGRVQGVFFRDSTRSRAQQIGINGWVRNLVDGRVEALACADEARLAELEKWLQSGPERAKVTNIERIEQTLDATEIPQGFDILPTARID